ncbi:hypothetical protein EF888_12365 [Silicimonas algicola]|uniref:Uncharacterized protein n=1 Tax=Silicimonas algicola TaxID=1826607 RepID=A0A316GBX5_9RHOB|nr:hypothetical protein [Silicimonas algicola]AZQ67861.1 hypothetical protein EF888_12365 [Silicimonas algicola]PWK57715.1 hypothetical protein C8D95_102362 [Silicimonas algicola]
MNRFRHDLAALGIDAICARFPFATVDDVAAAVADPDLLARYLARTHDLTLAEAGEMLDWLHVADTSHREAA